MRFAEVYTQPFPYDSVAYYSSGSYSIGKYDTAQYYTPDLSVYRDLYLTANQDFAQEFAISGVSDIAGVSLVAEITRYYSTAVLEAFIVEAQTQHSYRLSLGRTRINAFLLDKYVYTVRAGNRQIIQQGRILIKT